MSRSQRRFGRKAYRRLRTHMRKGQSRHHRKPKSLGGGHDSSNISVVPQKEHNFWHALFNNLDPVQIAKVINERWLDPHFKFICVVNNQ